MILAFGCSVTHGIDVVTAWTSDENIALSYPGLIAKQLKVECISWAFPGNSNENIFHKAIENIPKYKAHNTITAVIVGWTSPVREVWKSAGRTWQFIPSWASTVEDLTTPAKYFKELNSWSNTNPKLSTDKEEYLSVLTDMYSMITKYKFDYDEYLKKRTNYITTLRCYCEANDIRLIETCWSDPIEGISIDMNTVSNWNKECRHPNKEEHQIIANMIMDHYKL
jgi:hypothetical protein